jgi:hypothetical protein
VTPAGTTLLRNVAGVEPMSTALRHLGGATPGTSVKKSFTNESVDKHRYEVREA